MASNLADLIEEALTTHGPIHSDRLRSELARAGRAYSDEAIADVLHADAYLSTFSCLVDGRHALLRQLFRGRIFTHRLTPYEISADVLAIDADLVPLAPLIGLAGEPLASGGMLSLSDAPYADDADDDVLALTSGTLDDYVPYDLIGIRVLDDGMDLERVTDPAPIPDQLPKYAGRVLEMAVGRHDAPLPDLLTDDDDLRSVVTINEMVEQWCADDDELFRHPVVPLGEVFQECELDTDEEFVAAAGFDFEWMRLRALTGVVAVTYGISVDDALAVTSLARIVDGTQAAGIDGDDIATSTEIGAELAAMPQEAVERLTSSLGDPAVASAVSAMVVSVESASAKSLLRLLESWEPRIVASARVGVQWLRAQCLERLARAAEAETLLESAVDLNPHWRPALQSLSRYASDRGDAAHAVTLLERAGVPHSDADLTKLRSHLSPPRNDIGRNKPCWCGSNRKYKVCHMGREGTSIEDRANWLYDKAVTHVFAGAYRTDVLVLADIAREHRELDDLELDDPELDALDFQLIVDAVMFENGAFQNFLDERGFLLPHDEYLLAGQWLTVSRSAFEVEQITLGSGFTARDVRTGDRVEVNEVSATADLSVGDRFAARIVPVGNRHEIFGGMEILPLQYFQPAIELLDTLEAGDADAGDLIEFMASRFDPPTLLTSDGAPMVSCTARYEVSDVRAVRDALNDLYDNQGDGTWTSAQPLDKSGSPYPTVLGSLSLQGNELRVTAMNETRFETHLAELGRIDGLSLIDSDRTPFDQILGRARRHDEADHRDLAPLATDDLELADVINQFGRDYEESWLDMSIPALAGLTPREAADDPTRRGDLIRLIDSFESLPSMPGTMSPDRLRAMLNL